MHMKYTAAVTATISMILENWLEQPQSRYSA
jgi:hypothetical protein